MPRGGKRPGAGRKKGQKTKATVYRQEMLARAAADGVSPLEVMLTAMRKAWDEGRVNDAVQNAVHAAPYVHPRLAATDLKMDDQRTVRDYSTAELQAMLAAELDADGADSPQIGSGTADPVH